MMELAALGRVNLIAGAGALDFVGTRSAEKLVIDAEACGMIRRLMAGIEVSAETLAQGLIKELGPGGEYLPHAHTRLWFRRESYMPGPVIGRLDRKGWEEKGGKDAAARPEKTQALDPVLRRIMDEHGCAGLASVAGWPGHAPARWPGHAPARWPGHAPARWPGRLTD
jgi:trimethylamine:corrinoid methyltransferase-like protein